MNRCNLCGGTFEEHGSDPEAPCPGPRPLELILIVSGSGHRRTVHRCDTMDEIHAYVEWMDWKFLEWDSQARPVPPTYKFLNFYEGCDLEIINHVTSEVIDYNY